jgi:hypothetical protein
MHYVIEFLYTDNHQIYQTDVEMTPKQAARVEAFLDQLVKAGEIEAEGGGGAMVYEFHQPEPISFAELKKSWSTGKDTSSIGGIAKLYKVKL